MSLIRFLFLAATVGSFSGCATRSPRVISPVATGDPSPIARADNDATTYQISLRNDEQTICPRSRVQMQVRVDGMEGAGPPTDFEFRSPHGQFDANAFFTPNRDVRETIATPYEISTVFLARPDRLTVSGTFKPDYSCIRVAGRSGAPGVPGLAGRAGSLGAKGIGPYDAGGDGSPGGNGWRGGDGSPGPNLVAYATFVTTPFYDKLLAIKVEGDVEDFVLALPDRWLLLDAGGGAGGIGGEGGHGGGGGIGGRPWRRGSSGGPAGDGARGGVGGEGGDGGPGGTILFVYDARFPELASLVRFDVEGGAAGAPGPAGRAGFAGNCGSFFCTGPARGKSGMEGHSGNSGKAGPPGRASSRAGAVESKFRDIPGITLYPSRKSQFK